MKARETIVNLDPHTPPQTLKKGKSYVMTFGQDPNPNYTQIHRSLILHKMSRLTHQAKDMNP